MDRYFCFIVFYFLFLEFAAAEGEIVYNCSGAQGGILVSRREPEDCRVAPQVWELWRGPIQIFAKNESDHFIDAWKCSQKIYEQCSSSLFWFTSKKQKLLETIPVEERSCREVIKERRWNNQPLETVAPNVYKTQLRDNFPGLHFRRDKCEKSYQFVLERGSVRQLTNNGSIITSLSQNTAVCSFKDGRCQSGNFQIIWEPPKDEAKCSFRKIGAYEALVSRPFVIVTQEQLRFTVDANQEIHGCFKDRAFQTAEGAVITLPSSYFTSYGKMRADDESNWAFRSSYQSICYRNNKMLRTWWELAKIDPTVAMRSLWNISYISASFLTSDALAVKMCPKLRPIKHFNGNELNGNCYLHSPVFLEANRIAYQPTGSLEVLESSPRVDCSDRLIAPSGASNISQMLAVSLESDLDLGLNFKYFRQLAGTEELLAPIVQLQDDRPSLSVGESGESDYVIAGGTYNWCFALLFVLLSLVVLAAALFAGYLLCAKLRGQSMQDAIESVALSTSERQPTAPPLPPPPYKQ